MKTASRYYYPYVFSFRTLSNVSVLVCPHISCSLKFPIDVERGTLMHDMAITENYAIFLDLPMVFKPENLVKGLFPIVFDNKQYTR